MPALHNHQIVNALRGRRFVRDESFDCVYPEFIQAVSARFWTPISVALTAADWLQQYGCRDVLDVGAGAGKFCIVTSLASACVLQGIEQRDYLVDAACAAAKAYDVTASFEHGTIDGVDPSRFSAFYLYNPFAENQYGGVDRLDHLVELSDARWSRDLATVESWLDDAQRGTCVVTYHGFGGRIPDTYDLVCNVYRRGGELHLWTKRRAGRARGFLLELDQLVLSSVQLESLSEQLTRTCRQQVHALVARPLGGAQHLQHDPIGASHLPGPCGP
jgi:predicted RNA methylase